VKLFFSSGKHPSSIQLTKCAYVALTWFLFFYLFVIIHIIFYFLKYLKINFQKPKNLKNIQIFLKIEKNQILKKSEKIFGFFFDFF